MAQIAYLLFFALVAAALEVQIEGKDGWAQKLPTWRPDSRKWHSRIYGWTMSGKEMTGYHLLLFVLFSAVLHYPYFAGKIWNLSSELVALSLLFFLLVVEDFFWFLINPHYGIGRFSNKNISWHKKWFLRLPADYWLGLAVSSLFYGLSFIAR